MIHKKNQKKLGRRSAHRASLLRNLSKSLINHEQIITTLSKAKTLKIVIEKLITTGKKKSLHYRRQLISKLGGGMQEVNKILDELSIRYKERPGGYVRIVRAGFRKGDCAPMAIIQFVL